MSLVRDDATYISWRTRRRLKWIAKAERDREPLDKLTADEVCDRMVNERIEQVYPKIGELEKQFEAAEDKIIEGLLTE